MIHGTYIIKYYSQIYFFTIIFFIYKKWWKKDNKRKKTEKKTGKKINEDAILIKQLLDKKIRPIDIAKEFNISKQKVNYWKKNRNQNCDTSAKKIRW